MQARQGFDYKTACPICNGIRKDCRQSKETGLAFCRAEATPPSGWHKVKVDEHGFTVYGLDDGDRKVVPLNPTPEIQRLSSKQLDSNFRRMATGIGLNENHRSEVAKRGVEGTKIESWHSSSFLWSWPSGAYSSGFPVNLPGIDKNGVPRPLYGMAIGIPSVDGRILGAQYRPDNVGDGPKYFWVSSANIGGASPHLTNGEMPLGVYGDKSTTLNFCEGFLKSLIASDRHGITAIAQSSGNWAGCPKQLRYTIEQLGATEFILNPDGGMLDEDHRSVIMAYERLQQLLLSLGYEMKVRWWGQVHYSDEDVDEISPEIFNNAELITWHDFLNKLAYKWEGISSIFSAFPQPQKAQLLPIPEKCDPDEKLMVMVENYSRCRKSGNSFQLIPLVRDITTEYRISESRIEDLANQLDKKQKSGLVPIGDVVDECFNRIEELSETGELMGIPSGLVSLDEYTLGYQRGDLVITAGRPSMGKCLGKGTKVVMANSTLRCVEDIKEGDLLLGPDSRPRKVLSVCRGREMMYWVRQNKGVDYRVNESHILSVKYSGNNGSFKHGQVINISVKDYLSKSSKFQQRTKGYKVAVDFPDQPVPIDPYLLGLWLGDGSTNASRIHNPDQEIVDYLHSHALSEGYQLSKSSDDSRCSVWTLCAGDGVEGLQTRLRKSGLLGNKSIPDLYMMNSSQVRLQLLAGLMDTDGYYCSKMQCFENTQKSETLARQIKRLADSLGFRTSIVEKTATIKSREFKGTYWRVRVSGNLEIIPTIVKRKQARPYRSNRDWRVTGFELQQDGVGDYYGFEIDGDRLFLLEDMTVTHNTAQVLSELAIQSFCGYSCGLFSLEMSSEQLAYRMLSCHAGINLQRLKSGRLYDHEWVALQNSMIAVKEMSICVDDTSEMTIEEIIAAVDNWAEQKRLNGENLGTIAIDHLHILGGLGDDLNISLDRATKKLKALAKRHDLTVNALAQLSRGVEGRSDKRPLMSDIRASGGIEQNADLIKMLYRDEYYNKDTPDRGVAEIIIAKHRNGPVGTVKVLFDKEFGRFSDMEAS